MSQFPRVIVELDQDCLELTAECRRDALAVSDSKSKDKFFEDYGKNSRLAAISQRPLTRCVSYVHIANPSLLPSGTVFVSQFTLGGFLHSTRNVSSTETSRLDQVKDRTRIAAGLSIQSPKISGSINFAKVDEESTDTGSASLLQDVRLTWDAHGGDTLLCSK